jgi:hypothetical protein
MPVSPHENHDLYRFHRGKPDGPVSVFNQGGFLMAEYNPLTGGIAWLRIVPVHKRDVLERQLATQFPAVAHGGITKARSRTKKR